MKKSYLYILLFFLLTINVFAQSVDRSKKELEAGKTSGNSSKSSPNLRLSDYDPETIWLIFRIFGYASYGILIGDYKNETHLQNNLNNHPFSDNGLGNYSETDTISKTNFRLDIESKYLSAGSTFQGNHLDVKIRPSKYFFVATDWYQLYEYNTFTKKNDALSLYYFNVAYDRFRLENFNIGWTMGASYVGNEVRLGGFSYGLNAECFLNSKVSISADVKWSKINQNPVNSYQLKGKYFKNNCFGTISFERLKIATPVYNFIGIGAGISF